MKRILASLIAVSLLALAGSGAGAQAPVEYRFDEVRRNVTITHGQKDLRATKGQQAESGDKVETGWFSYALIGSDRHRARFELFSTTSVTLAAGTPGAILTLERGRIRAAFDKITGSEPRTVQTPGALLAVRGTQFDVEVNREGETTLDVFEGIVEVQSSLQPQPFMVTAGQESLFGPRRPPEVRPMPEHRRNNGPEGDRGKNNQAPNRNGDRRGEPGTRPDRPPSDNGHGQPGPPSGNPPPPPPPHKPPVD
jgi:FecR protein